MSVWKTPLSLIPDKHRPKQVRDASGNIKTWDEIYEQNPLYEVFTDVNGKPLSDKELQEITKDQMNAPGITTQSSQTPEQIYRKNLTS